MGRIRKDSKPTSSMLATAEEWKKFREDHKMSQKFLAEVIGVSRRAIQYIEAAKESNPQANTLKKFDDLRKKYEKEKKFQQLLQEE